MPATAAASRTILCLGFCLLAAAARSEPFERIEVLHPSLGEVVDAEEAGRWGLFPEVAGLRQVVFVRMASGVLWARITLAGEGGAVLRERNVPATVWASWRDDVAAGRRVAAALPDPPEGLVWPETALRVEEVEPEEVVPFIAVEDAVLADTWVMLLDLGYKHTSTRFGDYFTDMMMIDVGVGYAVGERFTPFLSFQAGFGDLEDAFEDLAGDGKSAVYAFELGCRVTAPLSRRLDAAASIAGGYYMRSMRWGGTVFLSPYGYTQGGAAVREFADWGGSLRLGFQYALSVSEGRARYLDVAVRLERYGADEIVLSDPETGAALLADDHDQWAAVSVGLVFGL